MQIEMVRHDQFKKGWQREEICLENHVFLLVTEGEFTYRCNSSVLRLEPGHSLWMPKGTLRSVVCQSSPLNSMFYAHFRCSLTQEDELRQLQSVYAAQLTNSQYIRQRFSLLVENWLGRAPGSHTISKGILFEIIGNFYKYIMQGDISNAQRNLAEQVQRYIIQHLSEPIRIEHIARHVDRSPSYISAVFRAVTGRTPLEYMHDVRIASAREMLLNTNATISEVSEKFGYCDQAYFSKMYKKITGHPPSHIWKGSSAPGL